MVLLWLSPRYMWLSTGADAAHASADADGGALLRQSPVFVEDVNDLRAGEKASGAQTRSSHASLWDTPDAFLNLPPRGLRAQLTCTLASARVRPVRCRSDRRQSGLLPPRSARLRPVSGDHRALRPTPTVHDPSLRFGLAPSPSLRARGAFSARLGSMNLGGREKFTFVGRLAKKNRPIPLIFLGIIQMHHWGKTCGQFGIPLHAEGVPEGLHCSETACRAAALRRP